MSATPSTRFQDLLLEFSQTENIAKRKMLEQKLWGEYGRKFAVFVLDMSGFSLLTRKYGIVHYLSLVQRMQLITHPIIKSLGGIIIKYEADNCIAVFPDSLAAVNAAEAIHRAFAASNILTPDDLDIHISCGIDYGEILIVGNNDCFGDPVNRAFKLGEDIAGPEETLITKEAFDLLPADANVKGSELKVSISGIEISAFVVERARK